MSRRPDISHGITGRQADTARFPDGLNLSFYALDEPERVLAARTEACAALDLQIDHLVAPQQIHGNQVALVGVADRGRGAFDRESALPETDAMITSEPGVVLFVSAADCVPLMFYDPKQKAIGIAHAGWRGTSGHVGVRAVRAMTEAFGTKAGDLRVGIGPSIGPCCYAVGDEVIQILGTSLGAIGGLVAETGDGRLSIDLWQANAIDLVLAGVNPRNIEISGICTACHLDAFFSHRAEHGRTGRFGAFIALKNGAPSASGG